MTHDLFRSFADAFNYNVDKIIISDLKEGVFFARVVCINGNKVEEIDARPSDAIAIALRFDAAIYTYARILDEAGIVLTEESEEALEDLSKKEPAKSKKKSKDLKDLSIEKLNLLLQDAIEKEDYEKAAKIRDELGRRN